VIQAQGKAFLDDTGAWTLWPFYILVGDGFCPDKWKAFNVIAH
jgi:hypothetical protein